MNPRSPYRLAVIDLDETLLGPDKQISPANRQALDRLRAAGMEVVIASGRQHSNIVVFEAGTGCDGWIISSQGAMVKHGKTGEVLHELTLLPEQVLPLCQRGREQNLSLIGYHRTGVFIERESEWTRLYASRAGHVPKLADFRDLAASGLQKLLWTASAMKMDEILPELEREFQGRLYVVQTEHEQIEFLSIEANKARGAQAVADKLGIAREEVVAFGDGSNDVPMLEWAGMSVAMDHGRASARKAARRVTPPGPPDEALARGVALVLGGQVPETVKDSDRRG